MTLHWHRPVALALLVWAVGLTLTGLLWQQARLGREHELQAALTHQATDIKARIESQLVRHQQVLKSFAAFFQASDQVTRQDFHDFYASLQIDQGQFSFAGVNYIRPLTTGQLGAHQASMRTQGLPAGTVRPAGTPEGHALITYIEPMSNDNRRALSLDLLTIAPAREALARARDTGLLAITGKLTLKQDEGTSIPGFGMYEPVYRQGIVPDTLALRQSRLAGWIGGPFRMAGLLREVAPQNLDALDLHVFDGSTPRADTLMYDTDGSVRSGNVTEGLLQTTLPLDFGGHTWTLVFYAQPDFGAVAVQQRPQWLGLVGVLLSSFAAILTVLLGLSLNRYRRLAQQQASEAQAHAQQAQRNETELALQNSELRWKSAIEAIGDGLWEWHIPANTVFRSESWKTLFGMESLNPGEAMQQFSERLHPEDRASILNALQDYLEGNTPVFHCQYRARCTDGSYKWILDRGQVIERNPAGRPLRMLGIISDITERKQTESNLRDSEYAARLALEQSTALAKKLEEQQDKLELLVHQRTTELLHSVAVSQRALTALAQQKLVLDKHAIVTITNMDGNITYGNDKFVEVTGYRCDEFIGQSHHFLSSGVHPKGFFKAMFDTLAQGLPWQGEICNRRKDGSICWLSMTVLTFKGDDGQPSEYIAVSTDITQSKSDQQALAHSLSLLNATLESTAYGILVVNREGHPTRWNQRFLELWHMPPELLAADSNAAMLEFASRQMAQPEQFMTEVIALYQDLTASSNDTVVLADGRVFKRISQPQKMADEVVGRVWSFDDITELKRTEQAALAASLTKSEFLANMSHEIRTPMNGVVGMVDVLRQTELQPEQQRMLATISQSSLALLGILNDILDYSKIEAGKLAVERIPTHLGDVAQGVVQLMLSTAQAKSLDLSLTLDPSLPTWVFSDPARLRQVLLNLIGNAIKFTPSDAARPGQVSLRVEPAALPDGGRALQWRIIDNGIGMSEEIVARLFQPFTQADASTSRQFGGTGLGLSISQRLVALLGGQMLVCSTPGQGSEFTVLFPLQSAPASLAPEALPERRQRPRAVLPGSETAADNGPLILLAEDNETNRDVLREQLNRLGYAAEVAVDGLQALEKWRTGRYALLLTDCHMPNMDGFALTAAIRAAEPAGIHQPIIAVTANAMHGEAERCLAGGMDDYLPKPLRMAELRTMMERWLPSMPSSPLHDSVLVSAPALLPPNGPAVWEANTLREMVGDNPGLQQRLLSKFLINAYAQASDLSAAAQAGDITRVADVAHTLKSAARMVGALALGEQCQQIETSGRAGHSQTCLTLAGSLADTLAQAAKKIRTAL